jgi:glycosyltransferase involved in cell wall biosynthesis
MPACTVVIPTFNHADELSESLASLVAQTFVDWEAIVVDDASTQGDVDAVIRAIGDQRVHYLRHPTNRGLAAARNSGIRAGTGALIVPFDSDDRLDPSFLARLAEVLADDPGADCVYPDFALFGDQSGISRYDVADVRTLLVRQWLPGPGCMYRRTLWERAGGYCEEPALRPGNEDWDFWLSAAEVGFTARHIGEPLYQYRISGQSMGMRLRYVSYQTREFIFARHRALFERFGEGPTFRSEGYKVSAQASYVRGQRRRALRLGLRALRFNPRSSATVGIIARSLVPRAIADLVRRRRGQPALPSSDQRD